MQRKTGIFVAIALIAAALGGYFLLQRDAEPPPVTQAIAPPPPPPAAPLAPPPPAVAVAPPEPEPAIVHPLEPEPAAPALLEPEKADAALVTALSKFLSRKLLALVIPDELIRRIVATVDNLPRQHLPASLVPIKRVPGAFVTSGSGETLAIAAGNSKRYTAYVELIAAVDSAKLVKLYREFYPLFQRAYVQMGYPKAYFNDRLVEAIDDLLAAPNLASGTRLTQPKVLYEFADADLQSRSAGQKIMMRIGADNAAPIKAKLDEIRRLVARGSATR